MFSNTSLTDVVQKARKYKFPTWVGTLTKHTNIVLQQWIQNSNLKSDWLN